MNKKSVSSSFEMTDIELKPFINWNLTLELPFFPVDLSNRYLDGLHVGGLNVYPQIKPIDNERLFGRILNLYSLL